VSYLRTNTTRLTMGSKKRPGSPKGKVVIGAGPGIEYPSGAVRLGLRCPKPQGAPWEIFLNTVPGRPPRRPFEKSERDRRCPKPPGPANGGNWRRADRCVGWQMAYDPECPHSAWYKGRHCNVGPWAEELRGIEGQ